LKGRTYFEAVYPVTPEERATGNVGQDFGLVQSRSGRGG